MDAALPRGVLGRRSPLARLSRFAARRVGDKPALLVSASHAILLSTDALLSVAPPRCWRLSAGVAAPCALRLLSRPWRCLPAPSVSRKCSCGLLARSVNLRHPIPTTPHIIGNSLYLHAFHVHRHNHQKNGNRFAEKRRKKIDTPRPPFCPAPR